MTSLLRLAVLDDLPEIIRWEGKIFGTDAWSPELVVAEVSHPAHHYVVAEDRATGALAGYAGLRADTYAGDGDIQTIAVVPEFRRAGVGRALLGALLAEAADRRVVQVFLEVRADNSSAIALYTDEGFEPIDRRVGYYQPDGVDAVVMRRETFPRPRMGAVGSV